MQHVAARARKRALVIRSEPVRDGLLRLLRAQASVDGLYGLLVREQNPVASFLGQIAPRNVHVDASRDQNVALVVPGPGLWPRRDGPLADRERRIGHHRRLRHGVHPTLTVALGAGALGRVGRKSLGVDDALSRRVRASTRVQHPHKARQRGHAAHRRAGGRCAALLLECDSGRQAFDRVHGGRADLVKQAARVGRDGFQVAALRLGVERPEGERGFARTGDSGKHDQRVSRHVHREVLEVVLARTANAHKTGVVESSRRGAWRRHSGRSCSRRRIVRA